jgi:acetyltransferase-like isoleucine patch superfamily enzyme
LTGPGGGQLAIIVATGQANGSQVAESQPWDALLCGRSAADWLLDTVEALRPRALRFTGCGAGQVRERAQARPALRPALAQAADQPELTVILSGLNPLLQPATISRALAALAALASLAGKAGPALGAALVLARGQAPWWSDGPGAVRTAAVACTGGCPRWLAELDPADPQVIGGRLDRVGVEVAEVEAGPVESLRIDDPASRELARAALFGKIAAEWQDRGVVIEDPATTRIDAGVRIGRGARIRPQTELLGSTVIGAGASIGPVTSMVDSAAGDDAVIRYSVCERVTIGDGASVGPFCWLRSGARLGARTRAGAFVEVSDSDIGDDTAIPHVAVVLSATVGRGSNIAGMSGTANFDGQVKHRTRIGDHVSIGAASVLIAPVSVGDGACTAAGSVITSDVPGGALAIARARQLHIEAWALAAKRHHDRQPEATREPEVP